MKFYFQAGPLSGVKLMPDKPGGIYAFITFKHTESVPYTINLMNGIQLFEKPLNLKPRNGSIHDQASSTHKKCNTYK